MIYVDPSLLRWTRHKLLLVIVSQGTVPFSALCFSLTIYRYANLTAANGLFRIDPRIQGNKLVDSQFKQYASKNDFSAAATTASGRLAVASNKGDIRLFDAIGKNAKVSLGMDALFAD